MVLDMPNSVAAKAKMVSPLVVFGIVFGHNAPFMSFQVDDDTNESFAGVVVREVAVPVSLFVVILIEYHDTCSNCCDKNGNVTTNRVMTKTIPK